MRHTWFSLLCILCLSQNVLAQVNINYQNNEAAIINPERGFYHHTETNPANYSFLNQSTLESYRVDGYSLILRVVYLSTFLESEISSEFLENMQSDFNTAREAGVKIIVRFAYTKKSSPPYNDAPLDRVKLHLQQLKPILHNNSDVIAVVQAGLIGAWGEWYYTDHYSEVLGNPTAEDWENRIELIETLLDAVPESRYVQVRTPDIKMKLTDRYAPITSQELGSGSMESRLGHHNDCFLASPNDVGTYRDSSLEKPYLEAETIYLPIGGETCGVYAPLSECENSLKQMKRFHWSYINTDYHPDVINNWREEGCLEEIQKKLGYRYRLISAETLNSSKPGGAFSIQLKIINDGWANAYNARPVELIIRHETTSEEYVLPCNEDPRLWSINDTNTINIEGGLPQSIPSGTYQLFLNLPDPEFSLQDNPDYSIQLANLSSWESSTGYNSLNHSIDIDPANSSAADYSGQYYFIKKQEGPEELLNINIDGDASEWLNIEEDHSMGESDPWIAKSYVHDDTLFMLVEGTGLIDAHQLFLNADNENTGYFAWQWAANGADYLVENKLLYAYNGTDHNWGWESIGEITWGYSMHALEIGIPLAMLNDISLNQRFSYAHINDPLATNEIKYLPASGELFIQAERALSFKGKLEGTASGYENILYWPEDTSVVSWIIEKNSDNGNYSRLTVLPYSSISFRDMGLESGQPYNYRMYSTDGIRYSGYSDSITLTPNGMSFPYVEIVTDGTADDWNAIEPVSVLKSDGANKVLKGFKSPENIYFLIQGINAEKYQLYLNTDSDFSSGYQAGIWRNEGFDLKISNDSLYIYQTDQWVFEELLDETAQSADILEIQFPAQQNYISDGIAAVHCGLILLMDELSYLPLSNTKTRSFPVYSAPVVPDDFAVRRSGTYPKSRIVVEWESDPRNNSVVLERAESMDGIFEVIAELPGDQELYRDDNLVEDTPYFYRIYAFNSTGRSAYSDILELSTSEVHGNISIQNISIYPSPVRESAILRFNLNTENLIKVSLYNSAGQEQIVLINDILTAGSHDFTLQRKNLSSGIYVLHFTTESEATTKKLIIK